MDNTDITQTEKVTFDEKQQAYLNNLIKEKQGEAAKELRAKQAQIEADLAAAKRELEETKAKLVTPPTDDKKKEGEKAEYEKAIAASKAEAERYRTMLAESGKTTEQLKAEKQTILKQVAISKALEKQNFIDASLVAKVNADSVKWDDTRNRFVVVGEDGESERFNSSLQPMTLEEHFADFAAKNPFLVKANAHGGTGATDATRSLSNGSKYAVEQVFGPKSNSAIANKLARENKAEYLRLKGVAKAAGLI